MAPPEATIQAPPLTRLLRRPNLIVGLCLILATVLAWWWLWRNGTAMPMPAASTAGRAMAGMHGMQAPALWSSGYFMASFVMWSLMMIAMMLPSATPMILLYVRFAGRVPQKAAVNSLLFAMTYVALWAGFSAVASLLQMVLIAAGLVSGMTLRLNSEAATGVLLIGAGLYQLSALKQACLATCRSPLSFMTRLWRPGAIGALRLGLAHGGYCLGCCWALMLLLFAGGVMNIAWIVMLAVLVLLEKLAPLALHRPVAIGLLGGGALFLARAMI
jgi:predicted metal-binding membrane protein